MPRIRNPNNPKSRGPDPLRTLTDDKAFYFYLGIGVPLGVRAGGLEDFAKIIPNLNPNSVEFHVKRRDFENWILMLGDTELANQITSIGSKKLTPLQTREQIARIVKGRVSEIKKSK